MRTLKTTTKPHETEFLAIVCERMKRKNAQFLKTMNLQAKYHHHVLLSQTDSREHEIHIGRIMRIFANARVAFTVRAR